MKQRENIQPLNVEELVINWHVTEACNYKCQYCYAKWNDKRNMKELIHHPEKAMELLSKLYDFFKTENLKNPLRSQMNWKSARLNFAGGETLLYKDHIHQLIQEAKKIGFKVSIITNGSTLDPELIKKLAPYLSILGVSVDSNDLTTNNSIGRVDRKGNILNTGDIVSNLSLARSINPNMDIKINSVINKFNFDEDMNEFIASIAPDKWKVLQMLPIITSGLVITKAQYQTFVRNHQQHKNIMSVEDNKGMQGSYLMIDPLGRFFQNTEELDEGYCYSSPIIEVSVASALSEVDFSVPKFSSRYNLNGKEV